MSLRQGSVHSADVGDERRRDVMVVTTERYNRTSDLIVVAPAVRAAAGIVSAKWVPDSDGVYYAIDRLITVDRTRLLEPRTANCADRTRLQRLMQAMFLSDR